MPGKQSAKSGGNRGSASGSTGKGQKSSSPAAASPATAPSFDSLPHATSGERLKGVEVGSTIPALMSELGVLLQQTPGAASGAGVARGQNGGLLFEDLDFAKSAGDAAAVFGEDVSRRLDQIPPGALERLSQVFQLQRRQAAQASAAAAAAAAATATATAASLKGGSGSPSAEVLDSDDDDDDNDDGDDTSGGGGSSGATGQTTPAPVMAASAGVTGSGGGGGGGGGGSEYDPHSAAGRRHNIEEMFELMQRSMGNYARGAAAAGPAGGGLAIEKSAGGGGAAALVGDMGLDPSAYSDPLTQLELFRAMMVATSKGRATVGGVGVAGLDGKSDDAELRTRSQRSGGGGGGAGGMAGGAAGGRATSNLDMQSSNPFQSFLDMLGPQLFGQVRLQQQQQQQRAAAAGKAAAAAAVNGLGKETNTPAAVTATTCGVAPAATRDADAAPNGAANLSDLQKRVEQVRVLSSSTLEELAADEVSDSTSGNLRDLLLGDPERASGGVVAAAPELELSSAKVGYCLTEAAAVAVSMLWSYTRNQQKDAPLLLGWNREAAQSQFNLLLFRLRQELAEHSPASLAEIARCFGGGVAADAEDVYRAINGVGVLLFFTCKPLPLLEKTCAELGISLSDSANADSNVMPELIAEKLTAFFYPMKEGKLTFAHLNFIPRVQVHEHAPGNYTCTIDNASNMGRMLRERLLSNRFSCNKIKWRAAIVNDKGELKFLVWHRCSTPLSVHLLVRTSEPKKKKQQQRSGSARDNANGEERETSATDELRANSALFVERHVTAAPGEMVGIDEDFLSLTVALSSPTTSQHGYRTYNKADDRLVFQFSLQLSNTDGTPLEGGAANTGANRAGSKQATPHAQQPPLAPQSRQPQQQQAGDEAEPSVNGSIACRTDGADSKEDAEAELRAAVRTFIAAETAARASIAETATLEYRHLQNDECRDAHQSRRRAEDRERKALLAKVGPPADLIREVEKLTQAVQTAQQQISKLNKDRSKDDRENEKMNERLAQQQGDLSKLLGTLAAGEAELAKLEEETKAAERRIEEKRARLARKEAKKAEQSQWTALKRVLEPTSSSTHHDTLAINDFGSFLQSSSVGSSTQQVQQQQQQQTVPSGMYSLSSGDNSAGGGMPSLATNSGGLTAFGTDPFTARQTSTTPPSTAANTTPVFSTQPKMGMATGSSLSANAATANGSGGNHHSGGGSITGNSTHHPLLDGVGGGSSSTASMHPGMVSPVMPPSPGVASSASAAMGSRNSPAPAMAASLGGMGMPLTGNVNLNSNLNNGSSSSGNAAMMMGGGLPSRSSASPSSAMMMGGANAHNGPAGGGLSFGLTPSLFSTNPVSHASLANSMGGSMGPGASPSNLFTSLDANAQPFSPSPPPGSLGAASNSNHSHGNNNNNNGGGGFAFTVTAGAGMHPGLGGTSSSSPLYQAGQTFSNGQDLVPHSPSPFSTTPMSSAGNGLFMVGGNGGNNNNGSVHGGLHSSGSDMAHHPGIFPPQPHSPNEALSFSTSLQWRN